MAAPNHTQACNRERGVAMVQVLVMTPFLIAMFILFNYVGNAGQTHIGNRNFAGHAFGNTPKPVALTLACQQNAKPQVSAYRKQQAHWLSTRETAQQYKMC
jgi:hypothetical protein